MKAIPESEMIFGSFNEKDLFYIEASKLYKDLGHGIKTVEFVLKYHESSIIFLEAKKSCPNPANQYESGEKGKKFEEYYSSITEKFICSLQIYLAAILDRYEDVSEVREGLSKVKSLRNIHLKCILVIKNADDISWLAGPLAELKARLLPFRRIWNIEVAVLNEQLARQYHLTC